MTSPTEEGSDTVDDALESSEDEAPNDSSADVEPSLAESNMNSQVESTPMNRMLDIPTSQEHTASQQAENNELEVEKNQRDPQEDLKEEESLLIQIPIPRKWVFFKSGLGRIPQLNTSLVKIDGKKPLDTFCSGNMRKISNLCYTTINYKIPFQLSISWRRPFISRHVMRSMTLRLLCRRHFSQAAGHQNTKWVKQQYAAFLSNANIHPCEQRAIVFQRPLRVYYYLPLPERITLKRMHQSTDTKGEKNLRAFVRSVHFPSRARFENASNSKAFEDHLTSHHITNTGDGWKYLCPICGRSFNNLAELKFHSCNTFGN
ncbi:CPX chromosomal region candidate gene 1 protein [Hipposideros larvatus]